MPFAHYLIDIAVCLRRLTWLPLPADPAEDERTFEEACWAYPLVGAAIGGVAAVAWLAAQGLGLAHGVAAVVALAASFAVTGAGPERALARAAGSLVSPRGEEDAPGAERTLIALALVVLFRATAIAAAAGTGAVGGVLIGAAAIAYACQLAAFHGAPDDEAAADIRPPVGGVAVALAIAAAISLLVLPQGWLAAVIVAGTATGAIVFAARRPGTATAGRALPAVLALAEILALLAVIASW